jgi:hypothetical protein
MGGLHTAKEMQWDIFRAPPNAHQFIFLCLNRAPYARQLMTLRKPQTWKHFGDFDVCLDTSLVLYGSHSPRHFYDRVLSARSNSSLGVSPEEEESNIRFPHVCKMNE